MHIHTQMHTELGTNTCIFTHTHTHTYTHIHNKDTYRVRPKHVCEMVFVLLGELHSRKTLVLQRFRYQIHWLVWFLYYIHTGVYVIVWKTHPATTQISDTSDWCGFYTVCAQAYMLLYGTYTAVYVIVRKTLILQWLRHQIVVVFILYIHIGVDVGEGLSYQIGVVFILYIHIRVYVWDFCHYFACIRFVTDSPGSILELFNHNVCVCVCVYIYIYIYIYILHMHICACRHVVKLKRSAIAQSYTHTYMHAYEMNIYHENVPYMWLFAEHLHIHILKHRHTHTGDDELP
jgi:hypothetical protein